MDRRRGSVHGHGKSTPGLHLILFLGLRRASLRAMTSNEIQLIMEGESSKDGEKCAKAFRR